MTFNLEKCNNLLKNPPQAATLRVFFWLALNTHEQTGFVRTTKKYLAQITKRKTWIFLTTVFKVSLYFINLIYLHLAHGLKHILF